ncbi:MAG: tetratricopeptide repeat protein [Holosporales bacterium]|jgi:hypothetical protein
MVRLCTLALILWCSVAAAAEPALRVGEHRGFQRIAIDWNDPNIYANVSAEGIKVTIHSASLLPEPLRGLPRRLPSVIKEVNFESPNTAILTLRKPLTVKMQRVNTATAIDFYQVGTINTLANPPTTTKSKDLLNSPLMVPPPASNIDQEIAKSPQPTSAPISQSTSSLPPVALPDILTPPQNPKDVPAQTSKPPLLQVTLSRGGSGLTLRFPWPNTIAAAVFQRAGYTWVIFDDKATFDVAGLHAQADNRLRFIEQQQHSSLTVLRLKTREDLIPTLWNQGPIWNLDFRPGTFSVDGTVRILAEPATGSTAFVELILPQIISPIAVADPEVGDTLWVAPTTSAGQGNKKDIVFQEFNILQSTQGIVIAPKTDDLSITSNQEKVRITSSAGLRISAQQTPVAEVTSNTELVYNSILFNMTEWRQGNEAKFIAIRQNLQAGVSAAPKAQRNPMRLRLAQFLFSYGYLSEANGVLNAMIKEQNNLENALPVASLKGAIALLTGHPDEAKDVFSQAIYNQNPEGKLWLGATLAALGDSKAAAPLLEAARGIPGSYPSRHAVELASYAVEALIEAGKPSSALTYLDGASFKPMSYGQRKRIEYLQARLLATKGERDRANAILTNLSEDRDQWARTRAEFLLIKMGLKDNRITAKDAIDRLERLRFAWRGDDFEFRVLEKLANLYAAEREYRKSLRLMGLIINRFPKHSDKQRLETEVKELFKRLYLNGEADSIPPLTALALYDEFRNLTPDDASGDAMIRNLADRLVSVDLLDRAGDLLFHQVRERITGAERAKVGTRLALLRLLDKDAEGAIAALDASTAPGMDEPEILAQRIRLRARALFMKKDYTAALGLLDPDHSEASLKLKTEIFWEQRDYTRLIPTLQRLLTATGKEDSINAVQARYILNLGLALSLSQQYTALSELQHQYKKVMEKTEMASAFNIIVRTPANTAASLNDITRQFTEIGVFQGFLDDYRQKLKEQKLSELTN